MVHTIHKVRQDIFHYLEPKGAESGESLLLEIHLDIFTINEDLNHVICCR